MGSRIYEEIEIKVVHAPENPIQIISQILGVWEEDNEHEGIVKTLISKEDIEDIVRRNHLSTLEHINITFFLNNISKSLLAQLTRHRIGSFSFNSQHYQNFGNRDFILPNCLLSDERQRIMEHMLNSLNLYQYLVKDCGLKKEDARQVLPNALSHCGYWTVNLRSLINFLNLRLCHRNTEEMVIFANKLYSICLTYWEDLFMAIGPDCLMRPGCTQGQLQCKISFDKRQFQRLRKVRLHIDEMLNFK